MWLLRIQQACKSGRVDLTIEMTAMIFSRIALLLMAICLTHAQDDTIDQAVEDNTYLLLLEGMQPSLCPETLGFDAIPIIDPVRSYESLKITSATSAYHWFVTSGIHPALVNIMRTERVFGTMRCREIVDMGSSYWLVGCFQSMELHNFRAKDYGLCTMALISASNGALIPIYHASNTSYPSNPRNALLVPTDGKPNTFPLSATKAAEICVRAATQAGLALRAEWKPTQWIVPMIEDRPRGTAPSLMVFQRDFRHIIFWRSEDDVTQAIWWVASDGARAAPMFDPRIIDKLWVEPLPNNSRVPRPSSTTLSLPTKPDWMK